MTEEIKRPTQIGMPDQNKALATKTALVGPETVTVKTSKSIRQVHLKSGGTLTVQADVDFMALCDNDLKLITAIASQLNKYVNAE